MSAGKSASFDGNDNSRLYFVEKFLSKVLAGRVVSDRELNYTCRSRTIEVEERHGVTVGNINYLKAKVIKGLSQGGSAGRTVSLLGPGR